MPTSPSSWRTCDATAYENLRSGMRVAIQESVAGHRNGDLAELLAQLWTVDGYSRSEIDLLAAALPASEAGGADDG